MAEKKEFTVDAEELAEMDKAVTLVEPLPEIEVSDKTLKETHPEAPAEVFESGIGVGFTTGRLPDGVSVGMGMDEERYLDRE